MARHFVGIGEPDTARLFRPSSMETIRSFGGDALTLVSEIPLFTLPGVGETIDPVDAKADRWRERLEEWQRRAGAGDPTFEGEARASGVKPVPIRDQMLLQWEMVRAGIAQVTGD
jgi:hypothetical protein